MERHYGRQEGQSEEGAFDLLKKYMNGWMDGWNVYQGKFGVFVFERADDLF